MPSTLIAFPYSVEVELAEVLLFLFGSVVGGTLVAFFSVGGSGGT